MQPLIKWDIIVQHSCFEVRDLLASVSGCSSLSALASIQTALDLAAINECLIVCHAPHTMHLLPTL
jgi:hypothetical protein